MRDGAAIDPSTWTRRARTGATHVDDVVDPARVIDHYADGATVVLQSLHRWWPPVTALCRELELDLGHATQANAYLTPAGAAGFDPHHDTHDVFVLQLHGTKDWVLREPLVEDPLGRHRSDHEAAAAQPVIEEMRLEPGDCLYLPRGYIHSARTESGASLHLTVGVLATTAVDLLRRIVDVAAEDPRFRRPLPLHFGTDPAVAEAATKDLVAEWMSWLADLDPAPLVDDAIARFRRGRRPLLAGQLLDLVALDEVGDDHRVRLRPGSLWALRAEGERAVLDIADRQISFPAPVEPALRDLLDGAVHRVGALADRMDEASRAVLVRRLVREGVLETVRAP
jgi:bifunctional lysine-specific demethylase and histidyl-hydroxylase NO66